MPLTSTRSTRTYSTLWDRAEVDRVFSEAARVLEGDFDRRRAHIAPANVHAMEARMKLLYGLWAIMLEPAPEQ